VKRKQLIKVLESNGCYLLRQGGRYEIYFNPKTGRKQPIPRHNEIDDQLAKHIVKELGL
jgi:predicted RNA binding protein YcfA (HicA-like mRNA interferase family)